MKILFLDQTGQLGGAEFSLLDIAQLYKLNCLVCLFTDGPFRELLQKQQIPVKILSHESLKIRKNSNLLEILSNINSITSLIISVMKLARNYDLIYANTQKAFVIGAFVAYLCHKPLIYHLHDILSTEHFSKINCRILVTLANYFSSLVVANSQATRSAFILAGGRSELTEVVYNGFDLDKYNLQEAYYHQIKQELGIENKFVVGHFGRLTPWKGQHILLEALAECPNDVIGIFVGDALFGEEFYVQQLQEQVIKMKLEKRVKFLGFRADVVPLMKVCDLIAHTSTVPEPFGRVIVEGMLCGRAVVATEAGGVIELIETEKTGWLIPPNNKKKLAEVIINSRNHNERLINMGYQAQQQASKRFNMTNTNNQITQLLCQLSL